MRENRKQVELMATGETGGRRAGGSVTTSALVDSSPAGRAVDTGAVASPAAGPDEVLGAC
jgi:hypothetical protein